MSGLNTGQGPQCTAARLDLAERRGFLVATERERELRAAWAARCDARGVPDVLVLRGRGGAFVRLDLAPAGRRLHPMAIAYLRHVLAGVYAPSAGVDPVLAAARCRAKDAADVAELLVRVSRGCAAVST